MTDSFFAASQLSPTYIKHINLHNEETNVIQRSSRFEHKDSGILSQR